MITATESRDQTILGCFMPGAVWYVPLGRELLVVFMKKFDADGNAVGPVEVDSTILLLETVVRTHSHQCDHRYRYSSINRNRYRVLCLVSSADGARSELVYLSKRWFLERVVQALDR